MQQAPRGPIPDGPDGIVNSEPMKTTSALYWIGGVTFMLLICVGVVFWWAHRTHLAREEMLRHRAEAMQWDRARLTESWGEKIDWYPNAEAEPALAVLPRSRLSEFDTIFVLFHGDRGAASLILSQIGGYYDDLAIDARRWPETLNERPLDGAETERLRTLVALMEARLERFDPPSQRRSWNNTLLRIARELLQRQQSGTQEGASPANQAAPASVG